jgi:hypothetical protein
LEEVFGSAGKHPLMLLWHVDILSNGKEPCVLSGSYRVKCPVGGTDFSMEGSAVESERIKRNTIRYFF